MKLNGKQLKDLQLQGKIRSFQEKAPPRGTLPPGPGRRSKGKGNKIPIVQKRSAEKAFIELNLQYWCNKKAVTLSREYQFDKHDRRIGGKTRQWRFDWAITALKIAVEYEGLNSAVSGHTTMDGFTNNADKYNRAQSLGWRVLRFTLKNYKEIITELNNVYDHGDKR